MNIRFYIFLFLLLVHMGNFRKAHADVYVDIGITYIDKVDITSSARLDLFGTQVTAEYTTRLEVEEWVPMLRVGYIYTGNIPIFKNLAIEYDTIGAPSLYIPRINMFYRFQFK